MNISTKLIDEENIFGFETVEEIFKVINDQSQLAVVGKDIIEKIENGYDISWREIQNNSVRVREKILQYLNIKESCRFPGIYLWTADYTPFLGYMDAVLKLEKIEEDGFAIV